MSEDVKIEVIRNTQESLSRYIKKPPLTEKLLRKPPFRYLHDITTSVMRETGYLQGLYTQDELNPENIKDREAKIAFLDKLITAVNLSTGVNLAARPNKIVAGLDVAKTNELLQTIAEALEKKVDSSEAVEKVLNKKSKGGNLSSSKKVDSSEAVEKVLNKKSKGGNQSSSKKEISKSKPVKTVETRIKYQSQTDNSTLKKKAKEKAEIVDKSEELKSKRHDTSRILSKGPSLEENFVVMKDDGKKEKEEKLSKPSVEVAEPAAEIILISQEGSQREMAGSPSPMTPEPSLLTEDGNTLERFTEGKVQPEEVKRPQSARAIHRKKPTRKPGNELDITSEAKNTVSLVDEPTNAEPQAFNTKDNSTVTPKQRAAMPDPDYGTQSLQTSESSVQRERPVSSVKRPRTAARPPSARPGAPRVRDRGSVILADTDKVVNEPFHVIEESKDLPKDDDDALVKVEISIAEPPVQQVEGRPEEAGHGQLVSQILETQRELSDTMLDAPISNVDISWGSGRQRNRESLARDVTRLQDCVQAVTRAANPLGQLIDYLQEDVEAMQSELRKWIDLNQQLSSKLNEEERLTEEYVDPLARRLQELNQHVEDQLEDTSTIKVAILYNDQRLDTLLNPPTYF